MANYITIDGGTTNTRICLVENYEVTDRIKLNIGARNCSEDRAEYSQAIKQSINTLFENNSVTENNITCILASGMITSELGLCTLPHISTPVGIEELHNTMYKTKLPEISNIPFAFIRGVKMQGDTIDKADMMRGEETELMGIVECGKSSIYILPGSHSKIIRTDANGNVTSFITMLTGEMIAALSQNTILRDAVDLSNTEADSEYLKKGFQYCSENGINEALFKVRVLKNIFNCSPNQTYSFFLGTILCGEIKRISELNCERVVIGGKSSIKNATATLLKEFSDREIIVLSDDEVDKSTSLGAVKIYEYLK